MIWYTLSLAFEEFHMYNIIMRYNIIGMNMSIKLHIQISMSIKQDSCSQQKGSVWFCRLKIYDYIRLLNDNIIILIVIWQQFDMQLSDH